MDSKDKPTLSFSFTKKKAPSKVIATDLTSFESKSEVADADSASTQPVLLLDSSKPVIPLKSAKPVIPLRKPKLNTEEPTDELTRDAVNSLIEDSKGLIENTSEVKAVPLLAAGRTADGEVPIGTEANYESIDVKDFGLAMMKGMGFDETKETSEDAKATPAFVLRPHGMGLGVDASQWKEAEKAKATKKKQKQNGGALKMDKGVHCLCLKGKYRDMYGVIESVENDKKECLVRLVESKKTRYIRQSDLRVVTPIEFKESSRYINNSKYEKYKRQEEEKRNQNVDPDDDTEESHSKKPRLDKTEEQKDSSSSRRTEHDEHQRDRDRVWVQPGLRVRFIDKDYKDGKYYKSKIEVIEVPNSKSIVCKTDSGKLLYDISKSMLETVIPRQDNAAILVVRGDYRGQLAYIKERDHSKCRATVKLSRDKHKISLDYDDICEYIGDD